MANRWKGNFVVATAATSSGTDYTGKANGAWGLNSQLQQKQANLWAIGIGAPSAPTIGTATATVSSQATVPFTASTSNGGSAITSYTATSTPGNITASSATSPITVTGLSNGTAYTFKVYATNSAGYISPESAASNSVTPPATIPAIGVAYGTTSPYVKVYPWITGFGTAFSNPATVPIYPANSISFNSTKTAVSLGLNDATGTNPFCNYRWDIISGFGTKYSYTPSAGSFYDIVTTFNNANSALAIGENGAPGLQCFSWTNASGIGSKYTNPSTAANYVTDLKFSNSDSYIVCNFNTTGGFKVYNFTNSIGFGSKVADPSTTPAGAGKAVSFNYNDSLVGVSSSASPYILIYPWSAGSFGTKYADPSVLPSGGLAFNFNSDSTLVTVTLSSSPYTNTYTWSSGFGTKFSNPTTLPGNYAYATTFNNNTTALFMNQLTSPFILAYAWSNGYGSKFADPSSLPNVVINKPGALNFYS